MKNAALGSVYPNMIQALIICLWIVFVGMNIVFGGLVSLKIFPS